MERSMTWSKLLAAAIDCSALASRVENCGVRGASVEGRFGELGAGELGLGELGLEVGAGELWLEGLGLGELVSGELWQNTNVEQHTTQAINMAKRWGSAFLGII
jgi:hypothetical protein